MKRERESSEDENGTTKKVKSYVKEFSDAMLKACSLGKTDVVRMLCANGADPNACTDGKREPLDEAYMKKLYQKNHFDVADMVKLIHYGAERESGLHLASENGHVDIVNMLIRNRADVNAATTKKWTAIHFASFKGHSDVVEVLIQNGADVNTANKTKWTPLHFATENKNTEIVTILLQNGADVNASNRREDRALDIACKSGSVACALQLVCFGAEMNTIKDSNTLINQISARLQLLRSGTSIRMLSLMSNEERRFMWTLAFSLTIHRREIAFKVYHAIRSFVTFHGIFMTYGYDLGEESVWKR